jgi:hypothetical protein
VHLLFVQWMACLVKINRTFSYLSSYAFLASCIIRTNQFITPPVGIHFSDTVQLDGPSFIVVYGLYSWWKQPSYMYWFIAVLYTCIYCFEHSASFAWLKSPSLVLHIAHHLSWTIISATHSPSFAWLKSPSLVLHIAHHLHD